MTLDQFFSGEIDLDSITALLLQHGLNVLGAVVILVVGLIVASWAQRLTARGLNRSNKFDHAFTPFLARLVRWAIVVFTIVAVLNRFGVQTASIIALLGAAGLAIGLALQGTLSNVAAGVMLLLLRPFKPGDGVDIAGTAGTVNDIGLFLTRVTTWDGVVVYLPNSSVWGARVQNFSQAARRRVELRVGIEYSSDLAKALETVRALVDSDPRVLSEPAPFFAVHSLTDTSVVLLARFWTAPGDLEKTQLELTQSVKVRFDQEGIAVAYRRNELLVSPGALDRRL